LLAPTDKIGQEGFAVVIARRERPIMLKPFGKGVLGATLRYPYEDVPDIKLSDEIRELAALSRDRRGRGNVGAVRASVFNAPLWTLRILSILIGLVVGIK
jgi:hypothetical protein